MACAKCNASKPLIPKYAINPDKGIRDSVTIKTKEPCKYSIEELETKLNNLEGGTKEYTIVKSALTITLKGQNCNSLNSLLNGIM